MINIYEVAETNEMIEKENLDVRTITMGISLLDCMDSDLKRLNEKIYQKIYESAKDLVKTGEQISRECPGGTGGLQNARGLCGYSQYFG